MQRIGFLVEGLVQGVGFRPFIYGLAKKYKFSGFVRNTPQGAYMELEGKIVDLEKFISDFHLKLPPLARIDCFEKLLLTLKYDDEFVIVKSAQEGIKHSAVLPDMAVCKDCLDELRDPANKRYLFPFTNCTNCGPRYSIVKKLPYDRPNTSMSDFVLCKQCQNEYEDPDNRRYHAQPICCPDCGPKLSLCSMSDGKVLAVKQEALSKLAEKIKKGAIVAVKGMGGFHLICDALNAKTVSNLRERKRRPTKPFAIMCKDIKMAKKYANMSNFEQNMLEDITKPIVLILKKPNTSLVKEIAPNTNRVGIFLPYTPLHISLFELLGTPIVATSANRSGEPIIYNGNILQKSLKNVADWYLDFDRDIINASDDSVLQLIDDKPLYLRLSRGITPFTFPVQNAPRKTILAVGADQKNALALLHEGKIIQSPYIGDMHTLEGFEFFTRTLRTLEDFYDVKPELILSDMHPGYATSRWAKSQNLPVEVVQHHHAHICGTMLEHGLKGPVLGVAWDGTGYGVDGTIWGGEFLACTGGEFERVAHFESFKLLGGEASIRQIWRIAYSMLRDVLFEKVDDLPIFKAYQADLSLMAQAHKREINSPYCSSVGRIFDAVAFIATRLGDVNYDGESGLAIESLYIEGFNDSYNFSFKDGKICYKESLLQMLNDDPKVLCAKFINGLVESIIFQAKSHDMPLVVSGGVFQNKTLLKRLSRKAIEHSIPLYFPQQIPPNDGGIAFGQLGKYILSQ